MDSGMSRARVPVNDRVQGLAVPWYVKLRQQKTGNEGQNMASHMPAPGAASLHITRRSPPKTRREEMLMVSDRPRAMMKVKLAVDLNVTC